MIDVDEQCVCGECGECENRRAAIASHDTETGLQLLARECSLTLSCTGTEWELTVWSRDRSVRDLGRTYRGDLHEIVYRAATARR